MAPTLDPRMMQVHPRIKYNTISGINGPLVILDNVRCYRKLSFAFLILRNTAGQIPPIQRNRFVNAARWDRAVGSGPGGERFVCTRATEKNV